MSGSTGDGGLASTVGWQGQAVASTNLVRAGMAAEPAKMIALAERSYYNGAVIFWTNGWKVKEWRFRQTPWECSG